MTKDVATRDTSQDIETGQGQLVWYNERKGYGFVRIGEEEIFLHRSTLDRFGLVRLLTGDQITVSLSTNEHGKVIKDLLTVERPVPPAPPVASEPEDGEVRAERIRCLRCGAVFRGVAHGASHNPKVEAYGTKCTVLMVRIAPIGHLKCRIVARVAAEPIKAQA